jgi:hypothetical protein
MSEHQPKHRGRRQWGLRLAGLVMAFGALLLPLAAPALAASPAVATSCSGTGCTGQDPQATGCDNGASTVASTQLKGWFGPIGEVQLRWSPTCQTNWARVVSWEGNRRLLAEVDPAVGDRQHEERRSETVIWTNMVYGQNICVSAWGSLIGAPWDSDLKYTAEVC